MKVSVTNIDAAIEVKTKGVDFEVRSNDGKKHLGNLTLNKTSLLWSPAKSKPEDAVKLSWDKFIKLMTPEEPQEESAKKPAAKTAKKPAKKTTKK